MKKGPLVPFLPVPNVRLLQCPKYRFLILVWGKCVQSYANTYEHVVYFKIRVAKCQFFRPPQEVVKILGTKNITLYSLGGLK